MSHYPVESLTEEQLKVLSVVCLATFLFFNSYGSINVALPTIQSQLGISLAALQWISFVGLVMVSSLSLSFGKAGDLLGRNRLYRFGVTMYAVGSGLAAFAGSYSQLLTFRIVMTIGLAMAFPMSAAILASTCPPQRRGEVLGWLAASVAIGRATGPAVGGLMLFLWGWRAIFLANFLIGLGVSLAVFKVLKGEEERKKEPFDFWGAFTLVVGYPSLLLALSLGAKSGWTSFYVLLWFSLSVLGLFSFTVTEFRAKNPLIRPSLFKSLPLSAAILSLALNSGVHYPIFMLGPLYMQNVLGFSPLMIGLIATTLPLLTAVTSPVSGRLADRMDAGSVAAVGLFFTLLGILIYSRFGVDSRYLLILSSFALIGVGIGFFIPANQRVAFSAVSREDYGILSAMLSSFGPAAGTIGIALTVALLEGTMTGRTIEDPIAFSNAQQFAFSSLLPFAVLAIFVCLAGKWKRPAET